MKVYKLNTATKKKYYKESKFCQKNYEESKVSMDLLLRYYLILVIRIALYTSSMQGSLSLYIKSGRIQMDGNIHIATKKWVTNGQTDLPTDRQTDILCNSCATIVTELTK